jgi:hypothetical protein
MRRTLALLSLVVTIVTGCRSARVADCGGLDCADEAGCILFTSNRNDGARQIFVMRPDGSCLTHLGPGSGSVFDPAWSPDGRRIAFRWRYQEQDSFHEESGIFTMNADGTNITRLTDRAS